MSHLTSLLILSHDVVGSQMAGPGIRYYHMARLLACHLAVTLAIPGHSTNDLSIPGVTLVTYAPQDWQSIAPLLAQADVALLPSDMVVRFPQLADVPTILVIDGYNPILAEWLAVYGRGPLDELRAQWPNRLEQQAAPIHIGDFFICASERQRDWWLGQLEAHGRINPATYQTDPTLRRLVDVVPYGMPVDPPVATRPIIKGVWPGIAPTDKIVLWGGGLWPWLDPLSAIHAMHHLAPTRPEIKLVFPGTRHPNRDVAAMPTHLEAAKELAAHYGLTDRQVFFGDWIAYPDWPNVLLESDVALTLHADSIETRLAFRSRVLDYIWADLPVVATIGDATCDLIAEYGLGIQVSPKDAQAIAHAIVTLVDEDAGVRAAAFSRAKERLNWARAVAPLVTFCATPQRAPDRINWLPHPHHQRQQIEKLEAEVTHWQTLVTRYEQGRFMRAMRALERFKRKLLLGR